MTRSLLALFVLCNTVNQATAESAPEAGVNPLSFDGLTLYGVVDIGLQYQTHGAPISDYFPGGGTSIVQRDGNRPVFGATPNNLGQSKVGLVGLEPILGAWSVVFRLETFFNPQSGQLSDGPKSLTQNNGRPLAAQSTNADSSVAGQIFQQSYVGLNSSRWGTLTFGRQNTVLADGIAEYDPNYAALAFSLIGQSGTASGGGYTEDRRLDSSIKYESKSIGVAHVGAEYKFRDSNGSATTGSQVNIGGKLPTGSLDVYYARTMDGISASPLTPEQVSVLPSLGLSSSNSLAAVVSDNEAYALMGSLRLKQISFLAGYERIRYSNPSTPITAGFDDIGGYKLAFVNNAAFPQDKIQQVYWAGIRYQYLPRVALSAAYYGYAQNSYGTGSDARCSSSASPTCSGTLEALAVLADYRLSSRFDCYAGITYTAVHDGLASGYLHSSDVDPTFGIKYVF